MSDDLNENSTLSAAHENSTMVAAHENSTMAAVHEKVSLPVGFVIIVLMCCSVTLCITIIVDVLRNRSGNFFKWPVIDRFTMYNVGSDLLFYCAQTALGINIAVRQEVMKTNLLTIDYLSCAIHAVTVLAFALSQIVLSVVMSIYVLALITKDRRLSLGRYDYFVLAPALGAPLIMLTIAAGMKQFEPNLFYCGFKEVQGFVTWHFLYYFLILFLSLVVIMVVYLFLWLHVSRKRRSYTETLQQQSSVNTNRLAVKLSLYVLIFVIQFGGNLVEGFWISIAAPPTTVRYVTVILSITGGILNGIVYYSIRKK